MFLSCGKPDNCLTAAINNPATPPVRPEPFDLAQDRLVEGLRTKGFDGLSPNGAE